MKEDKERPRNHLVVVGSGKDLTSASPPDWITATALEALDRLPPEAVLRDITSLWRDPSKQ